MSNTNLKHITKYFFSAIRNKPGLRQFCVRLVLLLTFVSLLMPFVFKFLADKLSVIKLYEANYLYTPIFLLGVAVMFIIHSSGKIKEIKPYKQSVLQTALFGYITLLIYALYFVVNYMLNPVTTSRNAEFFVIVSFIISLIAMIFAALTIFNLNLFKYLKKEIILTTSVTLIFFILTIVIRNNWHIFSNSLVVSSAFILSIIFPKVSYALNGDPTLNVQGFSATVGAPCSGIDSLSMFIGLFAFIFFMDFTKINKRRAPFFFIIGLAGMFIMSIIRITILFYVGTFNEQLALGLFHENLGWVFFIIYFFVFLWFMYPAMQLKQPNKSEKNS